MNTSVKRERYLGRDRDPEVEVARTEGSCIVDARGNRYIDFIGAWSVGNLGWRHPALLQAAQEFDGPDYVPPGYSYPPWNELASLLLAAAPGKLGRCFRATGGSEAVDLALQAAMLHTGRKGFLSLEGAYHGNTLAALSVGSSEAHEKLPNLLQRCHRIQPPLDERALGKFETRLKRRDIAAVIMEPIAINLGVLVPHPNFMRGLQAQCRRYGTLLVMDEVATGFGRTGTLFACEHFGTRPDILCLAKAIGGGLGPLGAMLATSGVAKSLERNGHFYSTYGWHPRSVHVAIANIRYFTTHRASLMADVLRMGEHFRTRLARMRFRRPAEVRIQGLAIAVALGDESYADSIQQRCRHKGLLLAAEEGRLLMLPALNIEREIVDSGLDVLASCI